MKTPFPEGKTFEELGLDPERKFIVVNDTGHVLFKNGDILEVVTRDGLFRPSFRRISDGVTWHARPDRLAYADEPKTWHNLEKGDVLEHDQYGEETVQGYVGDILFALDEDGFTSTRSSQLWQESGWKIKDTQPEELSDDMKGAMKLLKDNGYKITKE